MRQVLRYTFLSFLPGDPHAGERWNALTAALWGLWLLLPIDTFGAGLSKTLIGTIGNETQWGIFGFILGSLSLAALTGEWWRLRGATNVLLTMMWFLLALVTLTQSTASSGVLYLMLWMQQMSYVYESVIQWRGDKWTG